MTEKGYDIGQMPLSELEKIADDISVGVPADLKKDILSGIAASEILSEQSAKTVERHSGRFVLGVCAAASVAVLFFVMNDMGRPKDTFDDPLTAYAELEKTFQYISDKMRPGVEKVDELSRVIEKSGAVLGKVTDNR